MTSEVIAKANHPGGTAVTRRCAADRARIWIVLALSALPTAAVMTLLLYGFGLLLTIGAPSALPALWFLVCALWGGLCFAGAGGSWPLRLFGLRQPISEERHALVTAWTEVTRRAGMPADSYSLWIQEADEQFAVPDRMLTAPAESVRRLRPRELQAVLAQQLGQRAQGRAALWQLVFRYYNYPVVRVEGGLLQGMTGVGDAIAHRLPARGSRVFSACWTVLSRLLAACPTVAAGTVTVGLAPALALRLLPEIAVLALNPLLDRAEYRADRIAVELGYGPELCGVLCHPHVSPPVSVRPVALSVGPLLSKTTPDNRIRRIRDQLDELARRYPLPPRFATPVRPPRPVPTASTGPYSPRTAPRPAAHPVRVHRPHSEWQPVRSRPPVRR